MKLFLLFATFVVAKKDKKPKPPQGCNTDTLGHYAEKHTATDTNCKPFKGYIMTSSGVELEAKNMNCYRTCPFNGKRTFYKVKCKCGRDKVCSYLMKIKYVGWVGLNDVNGHGDPYIDECKPNEISEWNNWGHWSACPATCGVGYQTRSRTCQGDYCEGDGTASKACVDYRSTSCGASGKWYPFDWKHGHQFNEGNYCIFPSYGKGWFDQEIDGTRVQIGVECTGDDTHDLGDHVIAAKGSKCKLVCKADNGDEYRTRNIDGRAAFTCSNPIPIQMYPTGACYRNPFKSEDEYHEQCVSEWLDQGMALRDATLTLTTAIPWYFSKQTWKRAGCWPGCPYEHSLYDKLNDPDTNGCFKVADLKCPTELPEMTQAEIDAGATEDGIVWDCTNGNNPGSVCTKTCVNGHLNHIGNYKKECVCTENCSWELRDPACSTFDCDNEGTCLPGCDASRSALSDEYLITCEGVQGDSSNYVPYWVIDPLPVLHGRKCTLKCRYDHGYKLPGDMKNFDITCQSNGKWDLATPDFPDCYKYCLGPSPHWDESLALREDGLSDDDITWECTNGQEPKSVCTKKCPDGWKLQKANKNKVTCKQKKNSANWIRKDARCVEEWRP